MSASRVLFTASSTASCQRCCSSRVNLLTTPSQLYRRTRPISFGLSSCHRTYSSIKRPDKGFSGQIGRSSGSKINKSASISSSSPGAGSATPFPKAIVAYLDEYVIGQDDAKRALAVGVFNHYMRAAFNQSTVQDDNRTFLPYPPKKLKAKKVGRERNLEEEETILSDFVGQTKGSRRWNDMESQSRIESNKEDAILSSSFSPTYFSSLRPGEADYSPEERVSLGSELPSNSIAKVLDSPPLFSRKSNTEPTSTQLDKSNMILIGPSGSGKTHLIRTLSASLSVPFVHVDATPLTSAGYVGEDVESIMSRLLEASNWNVEEAERGIVCIDEVDKLASPASSSSPGSIKTAGRDVGGTGVQQALLRLLEGSVVSIADKRSSGGNATSASSNASSSRLGKNAESKPWWSPEMQSLNLEQQSKNVGVAMRTGGNNTAAEAALVDGKKRSGLASGSDGMGTIRIDTSKVLFVLCGAFVGLEDVIAARGARSLEDVAAEDLTAFGLIPEFVGRLPVMVTLQNLTEKELERILTEPRNALVSQYQTLFASYDIKLHFTNPAIASLAHQAAQCSTTSSGARMLRRLMEKRLLDAMYDGPGGGSKYALMDQSAAQGLSQVQLFSRGGRSAWLNAIEEDEENYKKMQSSGNVEVKKDTSTTSFVHSKAATSPSPPLSSPLSLAQADPASRNIQVRSASKSFLARADEATLRRRARARLTRPSRVGNLRILTSEG